MTFAPYARAGLAICLFASFTSTAMGGSEGVDEVGPVFVPPVFGGPVFTPPSLDIVQPGDALIDPDERTRQATAAFTEGRQLCAFLPEREYQVDCLADQLEQYAAALPKTAEFAEVRQIVAQTAQKLNTVARANRSTTKRPARLRHARADNPRKSARPVVPVAAERVSTANAEASAILREAETLLLRASEQSARRKVAFAQVAEAVGTSTVLLRSS